MPRGGGGGFRGGGFRGGGFRGGGFSGGAFRGGGFRGGPTSFRTGSVRSSGRPFGRTGATRTVTRSPRGPYTHSYYRPYGYYYRPWWWYHRPFYYRWWWYSHWWAGYYYRPWYYSPMYMGGGIVFAIIVILLGHTLNVAISTLGAFIHSSRLQFVEFFPVHQVQFPNLDIIN